MTDQLTQDAGGIDEAELERHATAIAEDGYTILEGAIDPGFLEALDEDLLRLERDLGTGTGDNVFEGHQTVRIYNLLVHGELYQRIPTYRTVLPLVERVLDPGLLISSLSSISIGPDETPQPIHADDQLIPLPKPHPPLVCNTMWALTDFTEANGATRIIPGSHHRDHSPNPMKEYESIPAEMAKGSVLVWNGSMWHGGGANTTDERRVGIAMNYCAGYIRQQENQQLGIPLEVAATFDRRLQELVGYSVYNNLIGHIDKRSPRDLLTPGERQRMVWDD